MRKSKLQYDVYIMTLLILKTQTTQDPSAHTWFIEKSNSLGYKYGIALFFSITIFNDVESLCSNL